MDSLNSTPLCKEHQALGARMGPFGGWLMPIQYEGIIAEHKWTRQYTSLFDICHMGEFIICADLSRSGLDRIVTMDLKNMPCGRCRYGFMLNEEAGIIDDLIVYRLEQEKWMLVVNAATAEGDKKHITALLSKDALFQDASMQMGKLDLQGPLSQTILKNIFGLGITSIKTYHFDYFFILGEENIISRTGYTGELGYEIYLSMDKIAELWKLLLKDSRIKPAGLGARDTLRLEMGYPLYGQDIDDKTTPLEAGLEKFVDFEKDFIGKEALLKQKKGGLGRRMRFFTTESRRPLRHDYGIFDANKKQVGRVTSGTYSPSLSCGIGMGYIEEGYDKDSVVIGDGAIEVPAKIVDKPFYKK